MYDLDTIKRMNNETGKHLTGEAQTVTEIQAGARQETIQAESDRLFAKAEAYATAVQAKERLETIVDCYNNLTDDDWPERNEH